MAKSIPVPGPTAGDWARFMAKVRKEDGGCWWWTAARFTAGYGMFGLAGKVRRAHRVLWVWLNGEPPDGCDLDHLCRNRACVNPAHLEPVPCRVNVVERGLGRSAVNAAKTHCKRGHPFDEANTRINPNGARVCRACATLRARGFAPVKSRIKPTCRRGHPWTPESTATLANGTRTCRICVNAWAREYQGKRRAALRR